MVISNISLKIILIIFRVWYKYIRIINDGEYEENVSSTINDGRGGGGGLLIDNNEIIFVYPY